MVKIIFWVVFYDIKDLKIICVCVYKIINIVELGWNVVFLIIEIK